MPRSNDIRGKTPEARPLLVRLQTERSRHDRKWLYFKADLCLQRTRQGQLDIPESPGERSGLDGLQVNGMVSSDRPEWGVYAVEVRYCTADLTYALNATLVDRMATVIGKVVRTMQRIKDKHGPAAHLGWEVLRFAQAVGATGFCYKNLDDEWVFEDSLDGHPKIHDKVWHMLHTAVEQLKADNNCTAEIPLVGCHA